MTTEELREALEPCPFCGRAAEIEIDREDFSIGRAFCTQCGACGPYVNLTENEVADRRECVRRWHMRISFASPERVGERGALAKVVHENGPVVIDFCGEDLAWRPLDYGSWTPLPLANVGDEMRVALEPFAKIADTFSKQPDGLATVQMDFAHFRRARAALNPDPGKGDSPHRPAPDTLPGQATGG